MSVLDISMVGGFILLVILVIARKKKR